MPLSVVSPIRLAEPAASQAQPISLRLSVTAACSFRCRYCGPDDGASPDCSKELTLGELIRLVGLIHATAPIRTLRLTGGEPLLRRGLPDLVRACKALGIEDVALTTNGQLLARQARELADAGVDRVNLSLDSLHAEPFRRISRGGKLDLTLRGLEEALRRGLLPLKLNTVVLGGVNDHEVEELLSFALQNGCQLRFLELMPVGMTAEDFRGTFVSWKEVRARLSSRFQLRALPHVPGATSRNFRVEDRFGRTGLCGFVTPTSHPFCHGCRRLRLTAEGKLFGCLASPVGVDLRHALALDGVAGQPSIAAAVRDAMALKVGAHDLSSQASMARIGG